MQKRFIFLDSKGGKNTSNQKLPKQKIKVYIFINPFKQRMKHTHIDTCMYKYDIKSS